MFRSKVRPLVFPQSEHARLAGELAGIWGNDQFGAPSLPLDSFILGTFVHDRGYGYFDTDCLLEIPENRWLAIQRRGMEERSGDEIADILVLHHILKLTLAGQSPEREAFAQSIKERISTRVKRLGIAEALFLRCAERLSFLDSLSFHFCFEEEVRSTCTLHLRDSSDETADVAFLITPGRIALNPWPLGVKSRNGFLIGYRSESYPQKLEPMIVPYTCEPLLDR